MSDVKNKNSSNLYKQKNLILHNPNNLISEHYEFLTPYLITIEQCNWANNQLQLLRLSPGNYNFDKMITPYYGTNRPQHKHNFIEIMFVISGHVIHHIENQFVTYQTGDCCIMNKNIRHCELFSTDFNALYIDISDAFISDLLTNDIYYDINENQHKFYSNIHKMLLTNISSRLSQDKSYLEFSLKTNDSSYQQVITVFDSLVSETLCKKPGYYLIIKGLISRLFSVLSDERIYDFKIVESSSNKQEFLFNRIRDLLEISDGKITRSEIAKTLNYNAEHINRIVKKFTGMTLLTYSRIFSLNKAKLLLIETDLSIGEILKMLDYSNRTYFNRIFKNKYGSTPHEYRKKNIDRKNYSSDIMLTSTKIDRKTVVGASTLNDLISIMRTQK